jgi:hypothetical protein
MELLILAGIIIVLTLVIGLQSLQLRHVRRQAQELADKPRPIKVSQPTAEQLEAKLTAAYEAQIAASVQVFGQDLKATSVRLGEQVSRLTTTVIEEELEEYQQTLEQVRATATEAMEKIRAAVEQQRIELRQGLEAELTAERERLADKFNAKVGDVVSSYIAESLGGGVDLGAQMQYIVGSLETHKEDIKKDLVSGI